MRTLILITFSISLRHLAVQVENPLIDSTNTYLNEVVRQRGPWGAQADISIDGGTKSTVSIQMQPIYLTHNTSKWVPLPCPAAGLA